ILGDVDKLLSSICRQRHLHNNTTVGISSGEEPITGSRSRGGQCCDGCGDVGGGGVEVFAETCADSTGVRIRVPSDSGCGVDSTVHYS
ncbi:hypothetical protein Pmar_PMAR003847, partial [Perkinsus marinus ATCC 50983]